MKKYAIGLVGCAVLAIGGCGLSPEERGRLMDLAKQNGTIIYFNGFLSGEAEKMTKGLAEELGMAHFGGRQDVLDILEAGEGSANGNNVVLHSAGAKPAYDFAKWCEKQGVDIRRVYSMEAFTLERFPENVGSVINYSAPGQWTFGEYESLGGQSNQSFSIPESHHLDLPWKAMPDIRNRMVGQRNPVYRKGSTRSGR